MRRVYLLDAASGLGDEPRVIVSRKKYWFLVAVLPLLVVTSAVAGSTVCKSGCHLEAGDSSTGPALQSESPVQLWGLGENSSRCLAGIGAELLKPPTRSAGSTVSAISGVKVLPAVPGAILMVAAGFLCVSFIRDRKMWLAAATCLITLGQTGLAILPHLAARLRSKDQVQGDSPPQAARIYRLDGIDRVRSDVEGSQYIGLLHHLAGIPLNTGGALTDLHARQSIEARDLFDLPEDTVCLRKVRRRQQSISAIITSSQRLIQPAIRPGNSEKHACFYPAFIFSSMARGPPLRPQDC